MPPWENFSSECYRVFRICILFSSITAAQRWVQRLAYIQTPTQSLLHTHLRRVRGGNGVRPPAPNLIFVRLVFAGKYVLRVVPDFSRVKYRIGEHPKTLDRSVPELAVERSGHGPKLWEASDISRVLFPLRPALANVRLSFLCNRWG